MAQSNDTKWNTKRITTSLFIAFGTGILLYLILLYAGWVNLRDSSPGKFRTYHMTKSAHQDVIDNEGVMEKLKSGILPDHGEYDSLFDHPLGYREDQWGQRFKYEWNEEEGLTIFSLGRDGQLGGTGLDADIYHDQRNYEQTLLTFRQFYESGLWTNSIVKNGGVFAFVVSLFLFCRLQFSKTTYQGSRLSWMSVVYVLFVFGLAAAIGIFLLPLHIPSGH